MPSINKAVLYMSKFALLSPFAILLLGTALLLCGCENAPPKAQTAFDKPQYAWGLVSGQRITVRGNADDVNRPYMREAFARYEKLTGNTIVVEASSHKELEKNFKEAFILGTAEKPDIVVSSGGASFDKLDPHNNFYDFSRAQWVDDLTDTALNQSIYLGKVVALPYGEGSVSGTLYNKKIFERLGIALPRTQQEFLAVCEVLLQQGIIPLYLPFAETSMLLYQFPLDSVVQHQPSLDALNQGDLSYATMPDMATIVNWYKTMANKGYLGKDYTQNTWAGMNEALRSGHYAMMLCWDTWLYTDFSGNPSTFGLMPAFMGVPPEGLFEGPNFLLLSVNKKSPRLTAALDFTTYMADPYNYNATLTGMYTAPVFKNQVGSISTPQYMETERRIEKLFHDSTARLRIRGFSQLDAIFIKKTMLDIDYSTEDCLRDMDIARRKRAEKNHDILPPADKGQTVLP